MCMCVCVREEREREREERERERDLFNLYCVQLFIAVRCCVFHFKVGSHNLMKKGMNSKVLVIQSCLYTSVSSVGIASLEALGAVSRHCEIHILLTDKKERG